MKKLVFSLFVGMTSLSFATLAEVNVAKVMSTKTVQISLQKSNPPQLIVHATGSVNSSGWKNGELAPWVYVVPPKDGILDMDFLATPPVGNVLWVISPITGTINGPVQSWMKGVRIHSSTNKTEVFFNDGGTTTLSTNTTHSEEEDVWPWPWNYENSAAQ